MEKKEEYLTYAPRKEMLSIQTNDRPPNKKNISGDAVNEHKELEEANALIGKKEIGQQRENL